MDLFLYDTDLRYERLKPYNQPGSLPEVLTITNTSRSSHRRCCIKETVLRNFVIFTAKHLCWSLFLTKLQAFRLFPVNFAKFLRTAFFYRKPLVAASSVGAVVNSLSNKDRNNMIKVHWKTVIRNFTIPTGKHLCWSLFLTKL